MTKVTHKLGTSIAAFILAAVVVVAILFFRAWLLKLCWNYTMPVIFGLPVLTYWQAFAVDVLSGMIFGSTTHSSKEKKS